MFRDAPATPPAHDGKAAWWLLFVAATLLGGGVFVVRERERARVHASAETEGLMSAWAEERATVRTLAGLMLEELRGRLGPDDPWSRELDEDPALAEHLIEQYWSRAPALAEGEPRLHFKLDSFSPPIDEPRRSLRETLPNIRVVDLIVSVQVELGLLDAQGVVHLEPRGGRLDDDVAARFRQDLEARGAEVRLLAAR